VISNLDFLGINYYGEEVVQGDSIAFVSGREYSDSGRAIFPEGLYRVLMHFHQRYNSGWRWRSPLPFWITENGIADENDVLRPAYLIEHLIAVNAAMQQGVPSTAIFFGQSAITGNGTMATDLSSAWLPLTAKTTLPAPPAPVTIYFSVL
jgi:beta-glucosidase/6-phospho-beta-glucosidase/beta-galactosidase